MISKNGVETLLLNEQQSDSDSKFFFDMNCFGLELFFHSVSKYV